MSQENVEVVRRLFDAVARRDSATVLSLYDPDFEWDGSRSRWAEVMSGDRHWHGHDGLRKFFREYYETWESLDDTIEEVIDVGEDAGRGRGAHAGARSGAG